MNTFPKIKPVERPSYVTSEEPLNPEWVSGFSEGDSSFIIYINSNRNEVQATFKVGLNKREKALLIKIQSFFNGIGSIYNNSYNNSCTYKITKKIHLKDIIMPHFNSYELVGNKKLNFLIWSQILSLIINKAHLTSEGLEQIKYLKNQLNKWD